MGLGSSRYWIPYGIACRRALQMALSGARWRWARCRNRLVSADVDYDKGTAVRSTLRSNGCDGGAARRIAWGEQSGESVAWPALLFGRAWPWPSTRSPECYVRTSSMPFLSSAARARTAFISSPKSTIRPVTYSQTMKTITVPSWP
jgi:hypothetical protein